MERIGEYLVRRLVGEGGMGKVYEAEERLSQPPRRAQGAAPRARALARRAAACS